MNCVYEAHLVDASRSICLARFPSCDDDDDDDDIQVSVSKRGQAISVPFAKPIAPARGKLKQSASEKIERALALAETVRYK